ncbi:lysine N(6)-hydroxylase/L-ornithine N(5)-oxygenase family protein [Teredinibacter sp. KSP-S5-2]|uniref:lysine N(6)-hydroxylase/L-ornithine N(5)-oxygenase family protein n=1 Tax=Teredinibacter sp. KSP-S5-2 TaxID=3034506 RepID=UPI002934FD0C|nr:SidA/IucD/PvdA family monooxygenase [Teredinibacter sp. KSP-S5-2]WNO08280.1 SidA/IucD/PvdA family monooxygenase [Teredinibacter sp. KSP-S5-2]
MIIVYIIIYIELDQHFLGATLNNQPVFDLVAVGLGPFNLSLACLASPLNQLRCLFLDKKPEFNWHPGMLVEGATLQNPFLADLVSMVDPTNRFSYLNYCKQQGNLYQFYIRENYYLNRQEYDRYCRWAANELDNVCFGHDVQSIEYDDKEALYCVKGMDLQSQSPFCFFAKHIVLGVGSVPRFPKCFKAGKQGERVHTAHYLEEKERLQKSQNITIVGSGQSGAEVFYDLLKESDKYQYQLNWVTRSPRFFQMETAKLTLELITADYGKYFYSLNHDIKSKIITDQKSIYNGINQSLINQIYHTLDDLRHTSAPKPQLLTNLALTNGYFDSGSSEYELTFKHRETQKHYRYSTDALVMATGYQVVLPDFIESIADRIQWDSQGRYRVNENWSVDFGQNEIFVQNPGFDSHGIVNPDLGLACYRNSRILHTITGRDIYPVEARTALQDFFPAENSGFYALDAKEAV